MKYIVTVLCFVSVCAASMIKGQEAKRPEKPQAVVVPREMILPVVVFQPDCPLQFEKVAILKYFGGGTGDVYQLRNRGAKPIRSYTVATSYSNHTGAEVRARDLLMPGQTAPQPGEGTEVEILPLTDSLREQLKLSEPMKVIAVFMVVRVEFADGSTYDDEPVYKSLRAYFEDLYGKMERLESLQRRQK